jgi:hypothetical protein
MATQHLNQVTLTSLTTHPSRDSSTVSFGIEANILAVFMLPLPDEIQLTPTTLTQLTSLLGAVSTTRTRHATMPYPKHQGQHQTTVPVEYKHRCRPTPCQADEYTFVAEAGLMGPHDSLSRLDPVR